MDKKENALLISHLYKDFRLPHERKNSLKERVLNLRRKQIFEKFHVLRDINLEVKKGEFFGIVGRNGSGKSTLLKIIGGIYQPTQGTVKVNGTLTPFIELGIGFNPELTGRDNVFLNGAILGLTRKEIEQKYDEIVGFAELEKFMDQKLKNYSSGMMVRLAFSIAIQAHNDILLIDEVLAVGDANFQRKCFKVFREIKDSGKTVIFVTHDMGIVQEFCDRALMIQDSKMVALGAPWGIARRYELANSTDTVASMTNEAKLERPHDPVVQIHDFTLTRDGKPTKFFSVKDDIDAEVTIGVRESSEIQMNLFFVRSNGEYLAGINTIHDLGGDFKPSKGSHTMRCRIKAGQLIHGEYNVGVGIYTPGYVPELIDVIDRAYDVEVPHLTIIDQSPYQDGQFYIQGEWSKF